MTPEMEGTEDALFDNAVDGTPTPEPAPAPAPEPAPAEQRTEPSPTDAALTPEATAERPAVDDNAPLIPSWRLREITEERRQAQAERDALKRERDHLAQQQQETQRRLAQLEKPAEQKQDFPDPLLDPNGFTEFLKRQVEERLLSERGEASLQLAKRTYKEEFDQAHQLAMQYMDAPTRAQVRHSADPGETLMGWFRNIKIRAEVGNDPAAYKQRVREEALKDPEFRKTAMAAWQSEASPVGADGRPNVQLAPSLNGISRSNAVLRTALQADMPDDALFDNVTTSRRP